MKAYSLLDQEVGYCQGLSFVAGILLLHMSEEEAFRMLKFLMFDMGLRKQYRPDMIILQVRSLAYVLPRNRGAGAPEEYSTISTATALSLPSADSGLGPAPVSHVFAFVITHRKAPFVGSLCRWETLRPRKVGHQAGHTASKCKPQPVDSLWAPSCVTAR